MHRPSPSGLILLVALLAGCAGDPGREALDAESLLSGGAIGEELDLLTALRRDGSSGPGEVAGHIAARLRDAGLAPPRDGDYLRSVPIAEVRTDPHMTMIVRKPRSSRRTTLRHDDDLIAWSGTMEERVRLDGAPLLFAGHGPQEPDSGSDAYAGRVLLILESDPYDPADLPTAESRANRLERGARSGAAAVFLIHRQRPEEPRWPEDAPGDRRVRSSGASGRAASPVEGLLSWEAATRLLRLAGGDLRSLAEQAGSPDFQAVPLDLNAEMEVRSTIQPLPSASVVAGLAGSDPTLSEEVVLFTGADGAGDLDVATLLAVARAFGSAQPRPRRSIFFAFGDAEAPDPSRTVARIGLQDVDRMAAGHPLVSRGSEGSSLEGVVDAVARRMELQVVSTPAEEPPLWPLALLAPAPAPDGAGENVRAGEEDAARIGLLAYRIGLRVANEARSPRWLPGNGPPAVPNEP